MRSEGNLKDLITNFNTTTGALASRQGDLRATLRELPQVLEAANPAFDELNASFPDTRAFAREILPGRPRDAGHDRGVAALDRPDPGAGAAQRARRLDRACCSRRSATWPTFTDGTIKFLPQADLFNRCALNNLLPTGDVVIRDGAADHRRASYQDEFFQSLVGLSGESQNFDGNGNYVRFTTGGGDNTQATGPINGGAKLFANFIGQPLGTRPARPSRTPPILRTSALLQAEAARPEQRQEGRGPVMRLLRKHARDFLALAFVALIGLGVGGYILSNQRFYPPEWVPVVGSDFVDVDAVLSNAQAVVPGQGQTVNIAGVKVGEIGKVTLENGRATVQMKIRRKYLPLYNDASILLRPKTGLKDMYLELDPGNPRTGKLAKGRAVPLARTLPDVNPDEFLASLDGDTQAYLRVLLNSGAEAFEGDAPAELRQTFKRFEPTTRDIDKITKQLSLRRKNVRRAIHNFQEVATALGERDTQLSQFVDSSNANFQAIASQEGNLRRSLELLPGTLKQTTTTLTDVDALASQLGPALGKLRPGRPRARALAAPDAAVPARHHAR